MKSKRYRVEAKARNSIVWEVMHYTDNLSIGRLYATRLQKSSKAQATRVLDQTMERVIYEQGRTA